MQIILDKYEDVGRDMAKWILEQMWSGHENHCPAFAGGDGKCTCVSATIQKFYRVCKERSLAELHTEPVMSIDKLVPLMMALQAKVADLEHRLVMKELER